MLYDGKEYDFHWQPHPGPQTFALSQGNVRETLYGGSRGGGKTDCGIVWMMKEPYITHPRYTGLVIRRNAVDLSDWAARANNLFAAAGGKMSGSRCVFPSGAVVRMGHLKDDKAFMKYQGQGYHKLLMEELTQIPLELNYVKLLTSCRSSIPELPAKSFATANPGGPGHVWVKTRWRIGIREDNVAYKIPGDGRLMMYIPARIEDNPSLYVNDPHYVKMLEALPEPLRSAWRDGDWDVFMGQMFNFNEMDHVCDPLEVPEHGPIIMTYDWGWSHPYSVGWWWMDDDGRLYRFTELYGMLAGQANVGVRHSDSEQAERILAHEEKHGLKKRDIIRLCDPTCFNKKPDYKTGAQGPATATVFSEHGIMLERGDPSRILKVRAFHERLRVKRDAEGNRLELPMMMVYNTCKDFIRTIPYLQPAEHNPEDVDKKQEDHIFDESSHAVMYCRTGPRGKARRGSKSVFSMGRVPSGK